MISMKITYNNEKMIIYLFNKKLNLDDYSKLSSEIKNIFLRLIKHYKVKLFGYFKVIIFNNDYCGSFLEIDKIGNFDYEMDIIDLKIIAYRDVPMYFEFDEYPLINVIGNMIYKNNKYYLEIDNNVDIFKYIEYGKITYE